MEEFQDEQEKITQEWLEKMGPTIHLSLLTHHKITREANNIAEPLPDELITFEYHNGDSYSIIYRKLQQLAEEEKINFINDCQSDYPEGTE